MTKRVVLKSYEAQPRSAATGPEAGERVIIATDLARSKWVHAIRWQGERQRVVTTPGELHHLQALVARYGHCSVELVYEACGFGYEIAWWAQEQRIPVLVIAPSTIERAPGSKVKTDRYDASSMALGAERGLLKGVYIPTREQHEYRQLTRTYTQTLKDRKRQQTRVRLLVQEQGRVAPRKLSWCNYKVWLSTQNLATPVRACINELIGLREAAEASRARTQKALRAVSRLPQYAPLVGALSGQGGIGWLTAIRFILEIGDIRRFATADSLPHFLGLTPSEYSTGETVLRGRIRRCGPKQVRSWLIECARQIVQRQLDPKLAAAYRSIAQRSGDKRAIVAVARKLAMRLRARWLEFDASAAAAEAA